MPATPCPPSPPLSLCVQDQVKVTVVAVEDYLLNIYSKEVGGWVGGGWGVGGRSGGRRSVGRVGGWVGGCTCSLALGEGQLACPVCSGSAQPGGRCLHAGGWRSSTAHGPLP